MEKKKVVIVGSDINTDKLERLLKNIDAVNGILPDKSYIEEQEHIGCCVNPSDVEITEAEIISRLVKSHPNIEIILANSIKDVPAELLQDYVVVDNGVLPNRPEPLELTMNCYRDNKVLDYELQKFPKRGKNSWKPDYRFHQ